MPRGIRTTKSNHRKARARKALALIETPSAPALDLSDLRAKHDVTDLQAEICCDIVFRGRSPQEIANERSLPPGWINSQFTKHAVAGFLNDLGVMALGTSAILAHHTMQRLLNARSDYVRYSAAQDLMDRAGLRARNHDNKASAASININIGVAPSTSVQPNVSIDGGGPSIEILPDAKTV